MATSTGSSSLMDIFEPPKATEKTSLLKAPPLDDLFQPTVVKEVPIKGGGDITTHDIPRVETTPARIISKECMFSTIIGSFTFLLYHVVFCLAQASAITRPHGGTPVIGPLAKMAALGILLGSPVFVGFLGKQVPAIYPTSDLFMAPFLANLAVTIDETLYQESVDDNTKVFLATFAAVSCAGLLLSSMLCILAARVKLANLGEFLPYPVLCGFFTAIGILMWTLAFSVDTGRKVGAVFSSKDWGLISNSLKHHVPSLVIGAIMHVVGPRHPVLVIFLVLTSIVGTYIVMWATGTSLTAAQEQEWFWTRQDLQGDDSKQVGFDSWEPPAPFGVIGGILSGNVHWGAFRACLPTVVALALLYLIRCSVHAAAVKKNIPNVTRKKAAPTKPVALQKILECGYGYSQLITGISGGIAIAPAVAVAMVLFKMGADGVAPQYGSFALLSVFYLTGFQLVSYLPKLAFSCLLVLACLDMMNTWLIMSYKKTKRKWEWLVCPLICIFSFKMGLLNAIFLGVALSTFIFVASFYRAGVVKYLANGLTLKSTIERGHREATWLDQHGDFIQILVLQNYIFFGNCQSLLSYISTMFEELDGEQEEEAGGPPLPPHPRYIIMDFTIVSGMDTSAVDLLRETLTLCKSHECRLFICGMSHSLRMNLLYAGLKPDGRTFYFQPDLELALGKAEDGLLMNVFHVVEQEEYDTTVRRRVRSMSADDNGFRYTLEKIDEQHGLNYADELVGLGEYTRVVELQPGESLFVEDDESVGEMDRGFFFIESGLMKVERDVSGRSRNTMSLRSPWSVSTSLQRADSTASIGHLNARALSVGRQDAVSKQFKRGERESMNFRLARIGPGWVVGTIEGCSGMKNPGKYYAVTACRLHLLPFTLVKGIEKTHPALVLNLFRLVSHLSARRQELTIEQLTQYMVIMNSPAQTSKPINRVTLAALQQSMAV